MKRLFQIAVDITIDMPAEDDPAFKQTLKILRKTIEDLKPELRDVALDFLDVAEVNVHGGD